MVNIDTVYQNVLALANKEQRGYITPQEFNLFADQAQMEIFEQYFYDINQFRRVPGNDHTHSDMLTNLEEKISLFHEYDKAVSLSNQWGNVDLKSEIPLLYRLGIVRIRYSGNQHSALAEEIKISELMTYNKSPLTKATEKRPYYFRISQSGGNSSMRIYPYPTQTVDIVKISYIRKPTRPRWGYNVVNGKALFNAGTGVTTNFELHNSDQGELIHKILSYAGITIKNPDITSAAMMLENSKVQQEKQ